MDATQLSTGRVVILKRSTEEGLKDPEFVLTQYLSQQEIRKHANNNSVPLLEVLIPPDQPSLAIMVIPFLVPWWDSHYRFETVAEGLDFIRQMVLVRVSCSALPSGMSLMRCRAYNFFTAIG